MAGESLGLLDQLWLEPIALLGASRRASKLSDEARLRMKPWVVAARSRFRVARELRDPDSQIAALALLSEAAFFALRALDSVESAPESGARSPRQVWDRFDALVDQPAAAPAQFGLLRTAFGTDDALALDKLAPSQANELRLAAEVAVAWLLSLAEIRTPSELRRARVVRWVLAALGLVAVLVGLVAYWLSLSAIEPR
jgi:hypothetical protein